MIAEVLPGVTEKHLLIAILGMLLLIWITQLAKGGK
jgi:hypothetical protein